MYNLIRNKYNNDRFNTEDYFSIEHFKSLSHYKRILGIKIFNSRYTGVEPQDLITQVSKILYGNLECSRCLECSD